MNLNPYCIPNDTLLLAAAAFVAVLLIVFMCGVAVGDAAKRQEVRWAYKPAHDNIVGHRVEALDMSESEIAAAMNAQPAYVVSLPIPDELARLRKLRADLDEHATFLGCGGSVVFITADYERILREADGY